MSAPILIFTECPHCHRRFRVGNQHAGRSANCLHCQQAFVITARPAAPLPDEVPPPPALESIGVTCITCQTRYYGTQRELGQTLPCPDCGTPNLLRPKPTQAPQRPAALDGEQYDLWEGEDQPWGVELAREQTQLIRATCTHCETITYVSPDLVGTTLTCGDCGQQVKVRPPQPASPTGPQPVKPGDEYQLDEEDWSGSLEPPTTAPIYEKLQLQNSAEERERQIRLVATDRAARPKLPSQPLLTGYGPFFSGPGLLIRWLTFSVMTLVAGMLTLYALSIFFDGYMAVVAVFALACAFVICVLMLGAASASAIAILSESSEGNRHVHNWPTTNPSDWFMETFVVMLALASAGSPGGIAAYLLQLSPVASIALALASIWLLFPITLLSSLEGSSPFSLLMPGVVGSLWHSAAWWLQFYLLSAVLISLVAGGFVLIGTSSPLAAIALNPVGWVGAACYFRLLGRLAWRIREA